MSSYGYTKNGQLLCQVMNGQLLQVMGILRMSSQLLCQVMVKLLWVY